MVEYRNTYVFKQVESDVVNNTYTLTPGDSLTTVLGNVSPSDEIEINGSVEIDNPVAVDVDSISIVGAGPGAELVKTTDAEGLKMAESRVTLKDFKLTGLGTANETAGSHGIVSDESINDLPTRNRWVNLISEGHGGDAYHVKKANLSHYEALTAKSCGGDGFFAGTDTTNNNHGSVIIGLEARNCARGLAITGGNKWTAIKPYPQGCPDGIVLASNRHDVIGAHEEGANAGRGVVAKASASNCYVRGDFPNGFTNNSDSVRIEDNNTLAAKTLEQSGAPGLQTGGEIAAWTDTDSTGDKKHLVIAFPDGTVGDINISDGTFNTY